METKNKNNKYQTIRQAAASTGVPEYRLRTWVKQGKVPGFNAASRYYVNVPLFLDGLQEGRING